MKVFVMTKAPIFGKEEYVGVRNSRKNAEKAFREMFPHMRKSSSGDLTSDANNEYLLFIHEEDV